mgnify:CR=1 FL=1
MRKPYLKLRRLAEDQGLEQQDLVALTGIKERTMSKRLNTPEESGSCWLPREITALCKVLHIPQEQIGEYFFPTVEKGESA